MVLTNHKTIFILWLKLSFNQYLLEYRMVSKLYLLISGLILIASAINVNSQKRERSYDQDVKDLFQGKKKLEKQDVESVKVVRGFKENSFEKMIASPVDSVTAYNPIEHLQVYYSFVSLFLLISKQFNIVFVFYSPNRFGEHLQIYFHIVKN